MKKLTNKKLISAALVLSLTITFFAGCSQQTEMQTDAQLLPKMDFEYSMTDEDVDKALALAAELEDYIDRGKNKKIVQTYEKLKDISDYIYHNYNNAMVLYYSDLENEENEQLFYNAEDSNLTVSEEYMRVLQKLYNSDLKAKEKVFADWPESSIKDLEAASPQVFELERNSKNIVNEFLQLPYNEEWSDKADELYLRYVKNSNEYAKHYGYSNYYDYAAEEGYMREYTPQQREAFRKNVNESILPLYLEVDDIYKAKRDALSEEQRAQFDSLRKDSCTPTDEYLTGYINSYPEKMKTTMNYLFERGAVVYTESENAHQAAYTGYTPYLDQPYIFLGNSMQDLLTVVHELGHYTAYYHFEDETLPYDTCEVHSQANEWLALYYLEDKIDKEVYDLYLTWRLRYGLDVIIMCTIIDEFEEEVYKKGDISAADQFRAIFDEILIGYENIEQFDEADELYDYLQNIYIEYAVYYLSYATSELASMSFYTVAQTEGYQTAQEKYADLCLETPNDNKFFETLKDVGVPDPFDADTVEDMMKIFSEKLGEEALDKAA